MEGAANDEIRETLLASGEPEPVVDTCWSWREEFSPVRSCEGRSFRPRFQQSVEKSTCSDGQWPIAHPLQAAIVLEDWGEIDSLCVHGGRQGMEGENGCSAVCRMEKSAGCFRPPIGCVGTSFRQAGL